MDTPNPTFLELLKSSAISIPAAELESIAEQCTAGSLLMAEQLVQRKILTHETAAKLWSQAIAVTHVNPFTSIIQPEVTALIPEEIARKACVMGLYEIEGVITVVCATPLDAQLIQRLEAITGKKISPVFAMPSILRMAIDVHYSSEKSILESIQHWEATQKDMLQKLATTDIALLSESTELVKIFEALLFLGIKERASDIHIEPSGEMTRVRFRIDGQLRAFFNFSSRVHPAVVARCKVMCNLNIAETRIPQDGRFSLQVGANAINFRVSFIPTPDGEKIVLRILVPTNKKDFLTLEQMLISQNILLPFKRLIQSPNGILFITGPTGSGKTTTIFAALHAINDPTVNIATIEDPIEIRLENINQSQVNAAIGLDFPRLLRAFLRQDPDVILVGEIRDIETAKIATEAALTGHLVFASLHTNNALQAVIRLIEMGVAPYMVSPSVLGVLAQRLAARICDRCKEPYVPEPEVLRRYFEDIPADRPITLYRGRGCPHCRGSGYRGRVAFHELVIVTESMRTLIAQNAPMQHIEQEAKKVGYRPLRYDGLKKVLLGLTTLEEIDANSAFSFEA
jgi:type IV pilus assembly protein PilB